MSIREIGALHFEGKEEPVLGRRSRQQLGSDGAAGRADPRQPNAQPFIKPQALMKPLRALHRPNVHLVKKMIFHVTNKQKARPFPPPHAIRSHFRFAPAYLDEMFFNRPLNKQLGSLVREINYSFSFEALCVPA
jgi:hypothetical protein